MKIVRYAGGAIVFGIIAVIELIYGRRFETKEKKQQYKRLNVLWDEWVKSVGKKSKEQKKPRRR